MRNDEEFEKINEEHEKREEHEEKERNEVLEEVYKFSPDLIKFNIDDAQAGFLDVDIANYWEALSPQDWTDITYRAAHLYNIIFKEHFDVEKGSGMDEFFSGLIIASWDAAIKAVCKIKNLDYEEISEKLFDQ